MNKSERVSDERLAEMLADAISERDRSIIGDGSLYDFAPAELVRALTDLQSLRSAREAEPVSRAPLSPPIRQQDDLPTWMQINNLFTLHRLAPPPFRLRDEIVTLAEWAWYGKRLHDENVSRHRPPADTGHPYAEDAASDDRWNAGVNYAIERLCEILGVDPKAISWDAATETLNGDVMAVICNVLVAAYGEEWTARAETTKAIRALCDGQSPSTEGLGVRVIPDGSLRQVVPSSIRREAENLAGEIWSDLDDVRRETNVTDVWACAAEICGDDIIRFAAKIAPALSALSTSAEEVESQQARSEAIGLLLQADDVWADYGSGFRIHFSFGPGADMSVVERINTARALSQPNQVKG